MELVKNIFFNTDKLVENSCVKISYTGKLFQENSEEVYIHYGFGLNWDNLNEIKMVKSDLGFQAEINLESADTLNFCFRDNNNVWDNNNNENYIFPIEKVELALVVADDKRLDAPRGLRKLDLQFIKLLHTYQKLYQEIIKEKLITKIKENLYEKFK